MFTVFATINHFPKYSKRLIITFIFGKCVIFEIYDVMCVHVLKTFEFELCVRTVKVCHCLYLPLFLFYCILDGQ